MNIQTLNFQNEAPLSRHPERFLDSSTFQFSDFTETERKKLCFSFGMTLKVISLGYLFFFWGLTNGFSQIKTSTQPDSGYYEYVKHLAHTAYLSETQLLALKPASLPDGFSDSLKKFDWFEIGSYHYSEKKFSSGFDDLELAEEKYANIQLNFKRYESNGVVYELFLDRLKNGTIGVYTTTFDENNATHFIGIENIKGQAYMVTENYGEKEKQKILSFQNNLMVMEISMNPFGNTNQKYRIAYLAVPRKF